MKIGSIGRRHVVAIDSRASPAQAAMLMRDQHVGALVVTMPAPEGLRVCGMVTDRDLVLRVLAEGNGAGAQGVGELASDTVMQVSEEEDVGSAITAMREGGVRRLLVTDRQGRVTGVVSLDDLIAVSASELGELAQAVRVGLERESAELAPPEQPAMMLAGRIGVG